MIDVICHECKQLMLYVDDETSYPGFICKRCKRELSMSKVLNLLALDENKNIKSIEM